MDDDKTILSEFRKAIRIHSKSKFVDMDTALHHKFDFQIQRIQDVLAGTDRSIPPSKWSYHRITLVTQGSAEYTTGIQKFTAASNTLIVVPARRITSSRDWSLDAEGYVVVFNIDFFLQNNFPRKYLDDKGVLQATVQPFIYVSPKAAKKAIKIFETILHEKDGTRKHKEELIALKVIELVILCDRMYNEDLQLAANLPSVELVKKFIALVDENFLKERSVTFYASQLNVHPNYLNALVKKHTGLTAKDTIQNRLLLEVKYLLHSTHLSIKEISHELGFEDPNYLTTFFKRLVKVPPLQYRASFV